MLDAEEATGQRWSADPSGGFVVATKKTSKTKAKPTAAEGKAVTRPARQPKPQSRHDVGIDAAREYCRARYLALTGQDFDDYRRRAGLIPELGLDWMIASLADRANEAEMDEILRAQRTLRHALAKARKAIEPLLSRRAAAERAAAKDPGNVAYFLGWGSPPEAASLASWLARAGELPKVEHRKKRSPRTGLARTLVALGDPSNEFAAIVSILCGNVPDGCTQAWTVREIVTSERATMNDALDRARRERDAQRRTVDTSSSPT